LRMNQAFGGFHRRIIRRQSDNLLSSEIHGVNGSVTKETPPSPEEKLRTRRRGCAEFIGQDEQDLQGGLRSERDCAESQWQQVEFPTEFE
jgi:hypothetical protein